ncbi:PKD domain-containing protein [Flavobacterium sp. '19STA2R22 D10 B1']|uniref:PKD domain-containing protein n=1 Tax=Flavobacterium aerium TaxID=3037261 RepID=UPI00278C0ACB|nr:PKD domain-containing protein [Flavobacterium sp. '19STA2R22 D10 B1']
MSNASRIKTHFDVKVIMLFVILFVLSCLLLAFKINTAEICTTEEFDVETSSYKAGELITFTDNTKDAYQWFWSFGDGSAMSYRSKVTHVFTQPGKYTVKLSLNDNCTVEKVLTILPKNDVIDETKMPRFTGPKMAYVGDAVHFKDSTGHAKSWQWRFGEGEKIDAIDKNPTYTFKTPGEKVVSLIVNDDYKYVKSFKINVYPAKKDDRDLVSERIERNRKNRIDPVEDYFSKIPDAPTKAPLNTEGVNAEVPEINEQKLGQLLMGVSENKLSYDKLVKYFCEDRLPTVQMKKGEVISLKSLNNNIRDKRIKIKELSIVKNKENCVTLITIDYRYKAIF